MSQFTGNFMVDSFADRVSVLVAEFTLGCKEDRLFVWVEGKRTFAMDAESFLSLRQRDIVLF
ncbi:hypothetical protein NB063_27040 [Rhodopirellula sp. ICT_H3.1]|uniref:Uncharacterized protein n=2 Tax=Aporhodopirellula aestuarii TaxID=2950107 RepID=A0ABT0UCU8_9BACT|nr:hypothetical protein [Aporhodopirellula aestuarii]